MTYMLGGALSSDNYGFGDLAKYKFWPCVTLFVSLCIGK